MSVIQNKISWMSELLKVKFQKRSFDEIHPMLEKIIISSRETVDNLIEIIWSMNPKNDELESLLAYMRSYILKYMEDTPFHISIHFPDQPERLMVNPGLKRNLFLVMKEALHNVVKYSYGTTISIKFECMSGNYKFIIEDDGVGMGGTLLQEASKGIENMRKRMENSGGTFALHSGMNQGTKIIVSGPFY